MEKHSYKPKLGEDPWEDVAEAWSRWVAGKGFPVQYKIIGTETIEVWRDWMNSLRIEKQQHTQETHDKPVIWRVNPADKHKPEPVAGSDGDWIAWSKILEAYALYVRGEAPPPKYRVIEAGPQAGYVEWKNKQSIDRRAYLRCDIEWMATFPPPAPADEPIEREAPKTYEQAIDDYNRRVLAHQNNRVHVLEQEAQRKDAIIDKILIGLEQQQVVIDKLMRFSNID
jgi:hypothetical protein